MPYKYFSRNGIISPITEAVVPLSDTAYSYGFGVYENIRVAKGHIYFLDEHLERLMNSAKVIALTHSFNPDFIANAIQELVKKNGANTCNLKVLLIGGPAAEDATLNILWLNPFFPDRKLYKDGATATTYRYEREFPQAKSLNMLSSYLAYREARQAGAYDALLINRVGNILEGTRTNFFALQDRTLISPPEAEILPGVTRAAVLKVAAQNNLQLLYQDIPLTSLDQYDYCFLTSTSSKIMPLRSIGDHAFGPPPDALHELMQIYNHFLDTLH